MRKSRSAVVMEREEHLLREPAFGGRVIEFARSSCKSLDSSPR